MILITLGSMRMHFRVAEAWRLWGEGREGLGEGAGTGLDVLPGGEFDSMSCLSDRRMMLSVQNDEVETLRE